MNSESACFSESLSVDDVSKLKEIKVNPNPTHGVVELNNLPINSKLILFNIHGVAIREINNTTSSKTLDLSNLESGVYFLTGGDNNIRFTKKILKI
jgi:hypothetical protein